MNQVYTILKKELKEYFDSPIAYILLVVFLSLTSWLFFRGFFLMGQASMRGYFDFMPWIFLFIIPAITMRMWAEEKKSGTIEVLMTSPLTDWQVVLGKFFASLLFLAIAILLSVNLPILLSVIGNPDTGTIIASYVGTLFMGAAYLAIGLWASSLTKNQIVAFIVAVMVTFILFILGQGIVLYSIPAAITPILQYIGMGTHYEGIVRGVLDSRDIIYYLLVITFFLYLNMRNLVNRT
jgi:ABC-2 type transport system permease protein